MSFCTKWWGLVVNEVDAELRDQGSTPSIDKGDYFRSWWEKLLVTCAGGRQQVVGGILPYQEKGFEGLWGGWGGGFNILWLACIWKL